MLEDFQAAETGGLISADAAYSFPEAGAHASSRSRRSDRIPSQLFRYRVVKRGLDCLGGGGCGTGFDSDHLHSSVPGGTEFAGRGVLFPSAHSA